MNPADESDLLIALATAEQRAESLGLVLSHLPVADRRRQVEMLLAADASAAASPPGVFSARRKGRLVGAILAHVQPGGSAEVWLPRVVPGEPESTAGKLLAAARDWLARQDVRIAQLLLATYTPSEAALLQRWGFNHLADLLYLVCPNSEFPDSAPATALEFDPYSRGDYDRMRQIVEATYQDTLDCPQLNGVRRIDDVLAGYGASGGFDPSRWLIVRHEQRDIGCLLLADYPQSENYELVYMGVVPAARGHGWGADIARNAQWLARKACRQRLVLAVDAANQPALTMYAHVGFQAWDRRAVFLAVFGAR